MAGESWTLDDIPWHLFESGRVDPDILKVVKAASVVEANGADYATYLCNVFSDDRAFQTAVKAWAQEEVQHGKALARWAEMADSKFDFQAAFKRFTDGYSLPLNVRVSVRGSCSGELVARGIVEVGTSSYYTALAEASDEPVLEAICKKVAADELRHYKLFYEHLNRYLAKEGCGKWRRLLVALRRITESEDDELAYAYYAANAEGEAYDRKHWSRAYFRRAAQIYRLKHFERAAAMTMKVAGMKPRGRLAGWAARLAYRQMKARAGRFAAAGA